MVKAEVNCNLIGWQLESLTALAASTIYHLLTLILSWVRSELIADIYDSKQRCGRVLFTVVTYLITLQPDKRGFHNKESSLKISVKDLHPLWFIISQQRSKISDYFFHRIEHLQKLYNFTMSTKKNGIDQISPYTFKLIHADFNFNFSQLKLV